MNCFANITLLLCTIFRNKPTSPTDPPGPIQQSTATSDSCRAQQGYGENSNAPSSAPRRSLSLRDTTAQEQSISDHLEASINSRDGNSRMKKHRLMRKLKKCSRMILCCIGRSNECNKFNGMSSPSPPTDSSRDSSKSKPQSVRRGSPSQLSSLSDTFSDLDISAYPVLPTETELLLKSNIVRSTGGDNGSLQIPLNEFETNGPESVAVEVASRSLSSAADDDSVEVTMDARVIDTEVASEHPEMDTGGHGGDESDEWSILSGEAPSGSVVLNTDIAEMFALLAAVENPNVGNSEGLDAVANLLTRGRSAATRRES